MTKRLDRAWAAQAQRDGMFEMVAALSRGLPIAIGLLVDGRIIRGVLSPEAVLTEAATTAVRRPLDAYGSAWEEDLKAAYAESFLRHAENEGRRREEDRALIDRYMDADISPTIDNIDGEDVAGFYREVLGKPFVVVGQARVQAGDSFVDIDVLTVRRAAISAWWFLDSEEGEAVTYGPAQS